MSADDLPSGLAEMSLDELRRQWVARLPGEPPKLRARELMALALAYRLQARRQGDLDGATKRRLAELTRRFSQDRNYTPLKAPKLQPGSSLIREWRGVRHEVIVTQEGFSYLGERLGSLSEVAERITGTRWNGLVFFGLKARSR